MDTVSYATSHLQVTIATVQRDGYDEYHLLSIELRTPDGWTPIAWGIAGAQFRTSFCTVNASECQVSRTDAGDLEIRLGAQLDVCYAEELFRIFAAEPVIHREQTFRFFQPVTGAINPGLLVAGDGLRYTFPLRACEQALSDTGPLRADAHWALPLPAHIWHGGGWVALYAVDRTRSAGTLDFEPGPTLGSDHAG
jgi:hypothetical protein